MLDFVLVIYFYYIMGNDINTHFVITICPSKSGKRDITMKKKKMKIQNYAIIDLL